MKKKLNISIDDVSPHPKSSVKILGECFELIGEFPEIKFSLFVPLAYWRTKKYSTPEPLRILEDKEFCSILRGLPKENFELCYHGFHHGIPQVSDNDEFHRLTSIEAHDVYELMRKTAELADLDFEMVLRPPAWRISRAALNSLSRFGFIFALSKDDYVLKSHGYNVRELEEDFNVVFCNVCPPEKPLKLFDKTEVVYHACEWDRNYLGNDKNFKNLQKWLRDNKDEIEFCFIEDLV